MKLLPPEMTGDLDSGGEKRGQSKNFNASEILLPKLTRGRW